MNYFSLMSLMEPLILSIKSSCTYFSVPPFLGSKSTQPDLLLAAAIQQLEGLLYRQEPGHVSHARANPHLGSKAIPVAVSKPSAGIMEHTGTVYQGQEQICCFLQIIISREEETMIDRGIRKKLMKRRHGQSCQVISSGKQIIDEDFHFNLSKQYGFK